MMEPILQAMANEFTDVEFIKIDVDELSVIFLFPIWWTILFFISVNFLAPTIRIEGLSHM